MGLPPETLVDHLAAADHQFLRRQLPRLSEPVQAVHVLAEIRADLEPYLRKREEARFPRIRTLASAASRSGFHCGSIGNPITVWSP